MIKIIEADLVNATEKLICHKVDCSGKMRKGISKKIKAKYPEVYKACLTYTRSFTAESLVSQVQYIDIGDGKVVGNIYGYLDDGIAEKEMISLQLLKKSFIDIKDFAKKYEFNIAMPYSLSPDYTDLENREVFKLIKEVFDDCEVTLYKEKK